MHPTMVELLADNSTHASRFLTRFDGLQESQRPDVVTVCCSDSRVLQDHIWTNDEPGRIFTCGNIGNRVVQRTAEGEVVAGDVLYPIEHTDTELAVVVGHTGCGAVTATYDDLTEGRPEPPGIEHCLELLGSHLEPGVEALPAGLDRTEAVDRLVEYNVDRQVELLRRSDEVPEDVTALGTVYDFRDVYSGQRGEIYVVNVDGTTEVEQLRDEHPEIDDRIERVWEYDV